LLHVIKHTKEVMTTMRQQQQQQHQGSDRDVELLQQEVQALQEQVLSDQHSKEWTLEKRTQKKHL
jgi:hypothetical protein